MTNDLIAPKTGGHFLDGLNLPKLIAGPAGDALARLIGGAVDIPAAWLHRVAQGVHDKTEAKSLVSKAVAAAAADLARNDPAIVQRAAHSLLAKELRHQTNREAIAYKTVQLISHKALDESGAAVEERLHAVNEDWLNVFARYAEDASSDRLQELWSRVLAGEIRRPHAFSLQTLRFIAEIDEQIAADFEAIAPSVINGGFIPYPSQEGHQFERLLRAADFGLTTFPSANLQNSFNVSNPGAGSFVGFSCSYKSHSFVVTYDQAAEVHIACVLLTRIGQEIYSITQAEDDLEEARRFAAEYGKDGVVEINYLAKVPGNAPAVLLWSRPPAPAPAA